MKHFLNKLPKENFYMIQYKIKEYNQNLGSFLVISTIWPLVQLFVSICLIFMLGDNFKEKKPMSYLIYFICGFIYILLCLKEFFKKDKASVSYVLKQAKLFFYGFLLVAMTFLFTGFLILIDENQQIKYNVSEKNLVFLINLLFFIFLCTVIISFLFKIVAVKKGVYVENQKSKNKIRLYNTLAISLPLVLVLVLFIFYLFMNIRGQKGEVAMPLFLIFSSFLLAGASAHFYMIYYLRKRFPEDYLDDIPEE